MHRRRHADPLLPLSLGKRTGDPIHHRPPGTCGLARGGAGRTSRGCTGRTAKGGALRARWWGKGDCPLPDTCWSRWRCPNARARLRGRQGAKVSRRDRQAGKRCAVSPGPVLGALIGGVHWHRQGGKWGARLPSGPAQTLPWGVYARRPHASGQRVMVTSSAGTRGASIR